MRTGTVVGVVVGALVLGFGGGIVAGLFFPGEQDTALEDRISTVESRLEGIDLAPGPKVAYVDAETLFTRVFWAQVQAERQAMERKQKEIQDLALRYSQGEIPQDQYEEALLRLQAELLEANLTIILTMLDKMITSPGFANFRSDLELIREQARPVRDGVRNLVETASLGIVDREGFLAQYQQHQLAFQQLDQLLTQAAAAKIAEIAQQVGREQGYDLVLKRQDVVIYRNPEGVGDISPTVEQRLWNLFPAG